MLRHRFGETVAREYEIQKITALYKLQHEIYKTKPSSEDKIKKDKTKQNKTKN